MTIDEFWDVIERSGRESSTRKARVAWLVDELARRPIDGIVDDHDLWTSTMNRGCTVDLYAAYWFVFLMGSLDGCEYFVRWLASLGRETFEMVTGCPDRLVEAPQVLRMVELEESYDGTGESPRPGFESLGYMAYYADEKATGEDADGLREVLKARAVESGFPLVPAIGGGPRGSRGISTMSGRWLAGCRG
ncbi:hypothetical protein GCM10009733_014260 [Nonomuraea maheshkhaliensis]|uniref:DUF4240 domain-containing protein n=1 Tax=Nonomuraea maheshkhaliensis TaxID=419590 RepID=A0ABP4QWL4_9ACTN